MIPFSKPTLAEEEIEATAKVLRSGWLAAGPETEAFEQEFSDYISPPGEHYHCIFTNSCTSALKMAYKIAREFNPKAHTVLCPKNTFCATYSAAAEVGWNYELVDDAFAYTDDNIITRVHYGGIKSAFAPKVPWIFYIEDSAHRIEPNDPLVGTIRCYSFYATKNMTTGSGGMFVTNEREIYERARLYWRDGLSTSTADRSRGVPRYRIQAIAGGYDGNDIAAAIGRVQLRKLPQFTQRRNDLVDKYNHALGGDWKGNHLYPFFVKDEAAAYTLLGYLKEHEIIGGYHYPDTGWNAVSLPLYPLLTDEEQELIITTINRWTHERPDLLQPE